MKKVFLFFLIAIFIQNAFAQTPPAQSSSRPIDLMQYGIKIEPDQRLILVMATLDAAEPGTALTLTGEDFRKRLRGDLQNVPEDLRQKIKMFVDRYKKKYPNKKPGELTASFVSLAYALGPAPDLAYPAKSTELPPDLLEVLDFATLVREYYRRSGIEAKLPEYVKLYQAEGDKMRASGAEMGQDLLGYLHTRPELEYVEKIRTEEQDPKNKNKTIQKVSPRATERRFFIIPELLAPANTINFQNVRDDYYAVVPPGTNLSTSEVRRAYLQFLVDPLVLRTAKDLLPFRDGIKQLLDERRKTHPDISPDVFLAVSRSMVAAVEAKEVEYQKTQIGTMQARRKIDAAQGADAKKAVSAELNAFKQSLADETAIQLSEAYERGAVLSFYFADQLKGLEDSGFDIASSFRDMVLSLDPAKESNRLAQYAEARQRGLLAREAGRGKRLELPKRLTEINDLINNKNYAEADAQLKKLLEENPNEPRIFYALGRLSSILAQPKITFDESLRDKRLSDARTYYTSAISSANKQTDPSLVQLSYVALGRIYEFYDQNEMAVKIYQAAVKIGDKGDASAYKEATEAIVRLTKKP
jgi:hypothetical protein